MDHRFMLAAYSSLLIDFNAMAELYNSAKVDYSEKATKRTFSSLVSKLAWKAWKEDVTECHILLSC